jgi:hypothetical protein
MVRRPSVFYSVFGKFNLPKTALVSKSARRRLGGLSASQPDLTHAKADNNPRRTTSLHDG